jgi:hypothetical protein
MAKKTVNRVGNGKALGKPKPRARIFDWRTFDPTMIADDGAAPLAEELSTYRDRLNELLRRKGCYVLIKGRKVVGIFRAREQALRAAVHRFGDEPVLVKQIVAKERIRELGHGST